MSARVRGAATALDNPVAEQAIEWMVLFRSGEATPDDYHRFAIWSAADPRHAQAWERMQGMLQRSFAPIRDADARSPGQAAAVERIMLRPPQSADSPARRKALRRTLAFAAAGVATATLLHRSWSLADLSADLRTGTGQRKSVALPDGSTLVLNARSAVDIDFSGKQRRVRLRQGELIATVAADAARPFVVETAHGTARALGTRFLVRLEEARSMALVLEHSIRVDNGSSRQELRQGEAAYYHAGAIERIVDDRSGRAAWADGMLVANEEPLGDVVAALRPYRKGFLRVSPEAARLRVLGAFPLDDTDNVLRSLEQTMPLRIRNFGNVLVTIDVR
ncbi:FecR family protein [Herbaspirillum sp. LeCh32-8]|uniref:FecR family protein n=1 Tax=Herbaspirillum sp. LeCh32-8 TaxID=2821356 RepID=UPI001AE79B55|nr:FecR family protein [Herbaspirillum sp. LeCh32-8]MBP0599798.1 FecR family protein [Herbaspirillum sp. LeCh32-8]